MGKQMPKVTIQIFKGEKKKTYMVLPPDKTWKSDDYITEANKLIKAKKEDLILKNGYVLDNDLYWHVKDMPDNLVGKTVIPVKVVYKK